MHLGHTRDPQNNPTHRLAALLLIGLGVFMGTIAGMAVQNSWVGTLIVAAVGGLIGYWVGRARKRDT